MGKKILVYCIVVLLLLACGFAAGIGCSRRVFGLDFFTGSLTDYRRDVEQDRRDLESARQYGDALGRGIDTATSGVDSGSKRLENGLAGVGKLASYQAQTRSLIAELRTYLGTVREEIARLKMVRDRGIGITDSVDVVPAP